MLISVQTPRGDAPGCGCFCRQTDGRVRSVRSSCLTPLPRAANLRPPPCPAGSSGAGMNLAVLWGFAGSLGFAGGCVCVCKWGGPVCSCGKDAGRARQAGSRWSVPPCPSPSPLATVSPAQVLGPQDPRAARGGCPNRGVTAGCPVAPLCHIHRGEGQLRPAGALLEATDGKQPSEQVNVSCCTRIRGRRAPTCPVVLVPVRLSTCVELGQCGASLTHPLLGSGTGRFVARCLHKARYKEERGTAVLLVAAADAG